MHELSLALAIVEEVSDACSRYGVQGVRQVNLEIGDLFGVVDDSLDFAFQIATGDTLLEGACLSIKRVPVTIFCSPCDLVSQPVARGSMQCPLCGQPSADLRSGREFLINSFVPRLCVECVK